MHVSEHPLERPLARLKSHTNAGIGDIDSSMNGKNIRVAGMISTLRTLTTKKGALMAFGTLEDLDDKIDLVFFPRTWEEVRAVVHVDQVVLVTGKVQLKDDQVNIIVNKVSTKIEGEQKDDVEVDDQFPYTPSENNGSSHYSPQPQLKKTAFAAKSEPFKPTQGDGQSAMPPPPPNFDEDWQTDDNQDQKLPVSSISSSGTASQQPASLLKPPVNLVEEESYTARSGEKVVIPGARKKGTQRIVVEIKAGGNWQETCRRTVKTAQKYPGQDSLHLCFLGQPYTIALPEASADFCDDLVEEMERIPGIIRVFGG